MEEEHWLVLQRAGLRRAVRACDESAGRFGLTLSDRAVESLIVSHDAALKNAGRVEFGGGVLPKLIMAFCDSPFIWQANYEETLRQLQEAFYHYKTETLGRYTDDELIAYMAEVFNGRAQGSVEYLTGTALDALGRRARGGGDEEARR